MMYNLFNRTEYSFRFAYGPIAKVIAANPDDIAGICDRNGTWGHPNFAKACKGSGKKPIFGVELALVADASLQEKQGVAWVQFIAMNNEGLRKLYAIATAATEKYYFYPRFDIKMLESIITKGDKDLLICVSVPVAGLIGHNVMLTLSPATTEMAINWAKENNIVPIAASDNYYPRPENFQAYQVGIGQFASNKATLTHILDDNEWDFSVECDQLFKDEAINNLKFVAWKADAVLPRDTLIAMEHTKSIKQMCEENAIKRGIDLNNEVYRKRLDTECDLIAVKGYDDYFYLISDLVQAARKIMFVGPARGSSCGSLVCYLLEITEIDPIPFELLFERFIDINRNDMPDIDIDFPDDKRHLVLEYLQNKYGKECVAQLGTVLRYKAKSAISAAAKELRIPTYEVESLKDAILERSGGDARAQFCIMDTFNDLDIGKATLAKFPELAIAAEIEAHAQTSGTHAAGVVVTKYPISNYCTFDKHSGNIQVDKKDAEVLNLIKIDVLGLRTLTILADVLEQIGWTPDDLRKYPLDDKAAFAVLNEAKFNGIFQFTGSALQMLTHQMTVETLEDIVSITALARPGPLNCGGASEFLRRRTGQKPVEYLHPMAEWITKTTYGVVVYQEQVMQISRQIGKLSWEDVTEIRKAMSKSLGNEFFNKYWLKFEKGAIENGCTPDHARFIWDNISTMGSWAFNRSHAVAYGLMSYWCCVLKSQFPLQFAAATLRHPSNDEQSIWILRELDKEGFKYVAFDRDRSDVNWSVKDGLLVGGFVGVKGVGEKKAKQLIERRNAGIPYTPAMMKLLDNAKTPYDMLYECKERFGHIFANPKEHNINSKLTYITDITQDDEGTFLFIAQIKAKDLRDKNEPFFLEKRGGKVMKGQTLFLNIVVQDDTSEIVCVIQPKNYAKYGKPIVEDGRVGDWYIWKGQMKKGLRRIFVDRWVKLT